jgi:phosphoglycolate phosphatase
MLESRANRESTNFSHGHILAFDLDGTLVNSENQIYRALSVACFELLKLEIPSTVIHENLGQPIQNILSSIGIGQEQTESLIITFRMELEKEILTHNEVFPAALDFLKKIRGLGFRIAIATTKPTYLAKMVVENSPLVGLIEHVQGTEDFPPKPSPEIFTHVEWKMRGRILAMFGDRVEDIEAANSAQITSIGIANGAHSVARLLNSGASVAYGSWEELASSNLLARFL